MEHSEAKDLFTPDKLYSVGANFADGEIEVEARSVRVRLNGDNAVLLASDGSSVTVKIAKIGWAVHAQPRTQPRPTPPVR